ncbi:MAG: hypothetical protein QG559_1698, partial [Campylobacterota bacterium]|nr:hypothetical protein [Campylobacterota bacterium]
ELENEFNGQEKSIFRNGANERGRAKGNSAFGYEGISDLDKEFERRADSLEQQINKDHRLNRERERAIQEQRENKRREEQGTKRENTRSLQDDDKDKKTVEEIKNIILQKNVSLVLNLHDGNGFYRKTDKGSIFNPNAWGQTCVIDQCILSQDQPFGNLNKIALDVKEKINQRLIEEHHIFDVKNTNTKFDDEAMKLSLTYFAVTHNKPAFAIESSKHLPSLSQKIFYHLLAIEEFMNIMNISFTRNFELNEKNIDEIVKNYGILSINNNFIINLSNVKKILSFIPLKSENNAFEFSHPLGSVVRNDDDFSIYIGNQKVTTLKPQLFKMSDSCAEMFDVIVDGRLISLNKTSDIEVSDDFNIVKRNDYRVNVIGFTSKNSSDESGVTVTLKDFDKKFSIDEENLIYRIEFYKNNEFCSMSKVHFR